MNDPPIFFQYEYIKMLLNSDLYHFFFLKQFCNSFTKRIPFKKIIHQMFIDLQFGIIFGMHYSIVSFSDMNFHFLSIKFSKKTGV
jgi:hypothetical protein